jgi:K+-sensing histidine kinase KdpD
MTILKQDDNFKEPWHLLRKQVLPFLLRVLAAIASLAATKLILTPFDPFLKVQIIALIFLVPVILSTVLWGLAPGILASIGAFLVFNYYYIPPYNTFRVHSTLDLITLFVFLVVSLVMSQLIGRAREAVKTARSREWEATRMYELISAFASLQDSEAIARELAEQTSETFHCQRVEVAIREKPAPFIAEEDPGDRGMGTPPTPRAIPLSTARGTEGELRIWTRQGFSQAEFGFTRASITALSH